MKYLLRELIQYLIVILFVLTYQIIAFELFKTDVLFTIFYKNINWYIMMVVLTPTAIIKHDLVERVLNKYNILK